MADAYRGSTPASRGPSLGDGTGGTSERPVARTRDRVLRDPGAQTNLIRLTPTGVDVTAGDEAALYDFGPVDKSSVGRYRLVRQTAASATADPLSDYAYVDFDIIEVTAGVFTAVQTGIFSTEGGTASDDADDTDILATDATIAAVADATLDGTGSDSRATIFVVSAADVVDAAAWTAGVVLNLGHLVLLDAEEADDHVFSLTRLS